MNKNWLNNKTVLITGATSGIGAGLTQNLILKHNCKVLGIILYTDGLKDFLQSLGEKKDNFSYLVFDISKRENWIEINNYLSINKIQVDVLINNAGIFPPFNRFENYSNEIIDNCISTDFLSVIYSVKELYNNLKNSNSPSIITISSSASLMPIAGTSIYTASKSASKAFTECFALEHPNFYVSCICPGFTKTNLFATQNKEMKQSKLISNFMTEKEKTIKKIIKGIEHKKKRLVLNFDAHLMDFSYKIAPKKSPRLFNKVMKISKQKAFEKIYHL